MKEIVIINGMAQSGKDTFVGLVSKYYGVMNYSSVDRVKGIAKLCGWNGLKDEKSRKFLSDLKKITTEYNDMSFNAIKDKIRFFYNSDKVILFLHVREPSEIEKITDCYHECKTLLVTRSQIEDITSNESDANVYDYIYDYVICNDGTLQDLEESVKIWLKEIKK